MTMKSPLRQKTTTLKPVRPNAGIAQAYESALLSRLDLMHKSILYWIKAQWKANTPVLASDERYGSIYEGSAANALNLQIARLTRRWKRNFDQGAKELATWFGTKACNRSQAEMKRILKDAGFSVEFKFTPAARDAYAAVINENVGLIRNIPEQYLADIQGAVMRSVAAGRDLGSLTKELEARYGMTRRRAATIARDQNGKATAVIERVRQIELGITTAVWKHSRGGKHPRASHLAFDGKEYDVIKGAHIDDEWIFPGQKINCRCVSMSKISGFIE